MNSSLWVNYFLLEMGMNTERNAVGCTLPFPYWWWIQDICLSYCWSALWLLKVRNKDNEYNCLVQYLLLQISFPNQHKTTWQRCIISFPVFEWFVSLCVSQRCRDDKWDPEFGGSSCPAESFIPACSQDTSRTHTHSVRSLFQLNGIYSKQIERWNEAIKGLVGQFCLI